MIIAEMKRWNWKEAQKNQDDANFSNDKDKGSDDLHLALEALGFSQFPRVMGGHNDYFQLQHGDEALTDKDGDLIDFQDQEYTVNSQTYYVSTHTTLSPCSYMRYTC